MKLRVWVDRWIAMLWRAMSATGNGYKRHSLRRTGRGDDRRPGKDGVPRHFRRIHNRMRAA